MTTLVVSRPFGNTFVGFTELQTIYESVATLVLRARRADDTRVVLKVPNTPHPTWRHTARLEHEHALLTEVANAAVIHSFGVAHAGAAAALVLEDFGGIALRDLQVRGERMPVSTFLAMALRIAHALGAIHNRHIVHQDVNPANVVVNAATGELKLIDLGLAQRLTRDGLRIEGTQALYGTLAYISPEQTGRMNRPVDHRTDLYSLGVTLYEMLTGQLPFAADDAIELVHCHIARTPTAPHTIHADIPEAISRVVLKLLAKNPEERYQSISGLVDDLERFGARVAAGDSAPVPFPLGENDRSPRLHMASKLYGREEELRALGAAFERGAQGRAELVTVRGDAGIGKSQLVRELHARISQRRGIFLSGKFDQLRRDAPFSAVLEALGQQIRQMLAESDARLAGWRNELLAAFGGMGKVLTDLLPALVLLVGEQPAVPAMSPREAENRLHSLFRSLLRVLARAERPLVLFLDDLQWSDRGSLGLIRDWLTDQGGVRHLTLVLAYRHGEVDATHPFALLLEDLATVRPDASSSIELRPLSVDHVAALLMDTLHRSRETVGPLARALHEKTAGNPFFLHQLLFHLHEAGALQLDPHSGWTFDLDRVLGVKVTDNVVDLMLTKMRELGAPTQRALMLAACIGNRFHLDVLATVLECDEKSAVSILLPVLESGLVSFEDGALGRLGTAPERVSEGTASNEPIALRFAHDRVQEAASELVSAAARQGAHLDIARLLTSAQSTRSARQTIEIVGHYMQAEPLVSTPEERIRVAALALEAGRALRSALAHDVGSRFLGLGVRLLPADAFTAHGDLAFAMHLELAQFLYLCGLHERAEGLFATLLAIENSLAQSLGLAEVRISLYESQARFQEALDCGIACAAKLGVQLEARPSEAFVGQLVGEAMGALGARSFDDILRGEKLADPDKIAVQAFLAHLVGPAFFVGPLSFAMLAARSVQVALRDGNTEFSAKAFSNLALTMAATGHGELAIGFGKLAWDLSERYDNVYIRGSVAFCFAGWINHRIAPLRAANEINRRAYEWNMAAGDLATAGYVTSQFTALGLMTGVALSQVHEDAVRWGEAARSIRSEEMTDLCQLQDQVPRGLLGDPALPLTEGLEARVLGCRSPVTASFVHIARLMTKLVLDDREGVWIEAQEALRLAEVGVGGHFTHAHTLIFYGLAAARAHERAHNHEERGEMRAGIEGARGLLQGLAKTAPMNFAAPVRALDAEILLIEGNPTGALDALDEAIAGFVEQGTIHHAALANERAAQVLLRLGKTTRARGYLLEAYDRYAQWGARTKTLQLVEAHPELRRRNAGTLPPPPKVTTSMTSTEGSSAQLDMLTIIKASQSIGGEIVFQRLVAALMRAAFESAGADRGALLVARGDQLAVVAEGRAESGDLTLLDIPLEAWDQGARSVAHFVHRALESVVWHEAERDPRFESEPYLRGGVRSLLAMPIVKSGHLIAVLMLENHLTTRVFTSQRIRILQILAGQMAMSLENARLYEDLAHSLSAEQRATAKERVALSAEQEARRKERLAHEDWVRTERARQHLASSIEAARAVQQALLVPGPSLPGIEMAHFYRPADRAGGDWYGTYALSTRPRMYVLLGDVTGHGIPSALVTAAAAGAAASAIDRLDQESGSLFDDLQRIARALDQAVLFTGKQAGRSMTMAMLALDWETGEAAYLNAGHLPVLHGVVGRQKALLNRGPLLGFGDSAAAMPLAFRLEPGETLFVFTDGLLENVDEDRRSLSMAKLMRLLARHDGPQAQVDALVPVVDAFTVSESSDDTTFVALRFRGREGRI